MYTIFLTVHYILKGDYIFNCTWYRLKKIYTQKNIWRRLRRLHLTYSYNIKNACAHMYTRTHTRISAHACMRIII